MRKDALQISQDQFLYPLSRVLIGLLGHRRRDAHAGQLNLPVNLCDAVLGAQFS